jgi:DNA repair exonuclease SbcCD nuclease subunit
MPIRFLHAADLHIGLRITRFDEKTGLKLNAVRYQAIKNIQKLAIANAAQFVVIAGDLFDSFNVKQDIGRQVFQILNGSGWPCPVFVIAGNHDPLIPGGVWDRAPWEEDGQMRRVQLLRENVPVEVQGLPQKVVLFPCSLKTAKDYFDPTDWIRKHPRSTTPDAIRIGIAHGSLRIMPDLPEDDFLIAPDASEVCELDYLALGHWHTRYQHGLRTAYSGTHEPMRFPSESSEESIGWANSSSDKRAERFNDDGTGNVNLVSIQAAQELPAITCLPSQVLTWRSEERDISAGIGRVSSEFSNLSSPQTTVLRLVLKGVVSPEQFHRLEADLKDVNLHLLHDGSSIDFSQVLIQPDEETLARTIGSGALAKVAAQLQLPATPEETTVNEHALKLLYQFAWQGAQS